MKIIRRLIIFVILLPLVFLIWLSYTESGLHWVFNQIESYLPAELSIKKLQGNLAGPVTISGLEYQQDGVQLKTEKVIIDWQPLTLLTASINISRLRVDALTVVLPETKNNDKPQPLPDISLPWRIKIKDAVINDIQVNQNQQAFKLQQIELDASTLLNRININTLAVKHDNFALAIDGDVHLNRNYQHNININWQTTLPSKALIKGHGQLKGDVKTTHIKQRLSGPIKLSLDATVNDLLQRINWQAKINATQIIATELGFNLPVLDGMLAVEATGDLSTAKLSGKLNGEFPELGKVNASFNLQRLSNNTVQIEQLQLHSSSRDTRIHASGLWNPAANGGDINLSLDWNNLRWPMQDPAWFNSADGKANIKGNTEHFQFDLETDRPWPQAPPSRWFAQAEGNIAGLNFHSLRVSALNGVAIASGPLSWSPHLNWQAKITANNIDPASLFAEWPGQLNATLSSKGHTENGRLVVDNDISQLTGRLRGYPVSLNSQLTWRDNGVDIDQLKFRSGSSEIKAHGRVGDTYNLQWAVAANNLAELYPRALGQLNSKGLITGPRNTPAIKADLHGKKLGLPDITIGTVDAEVALDILNLQALNFHLTAEALKFKTHDVHSLTINADAQQLTATATADDLTADFELHGKLQAGSLHAQIERASLQSKRFNNWQIIAPAKLDISKEKQAVETLCWQNQDARICTAFKREQAAWNMNLKLIRAPLMLLSPWLPSDMKIEGLVDASAELHSKTPGQALGQATFVLAPGSVSYPLVEGERDHWAYRGGKAEASMNEQGITTKADFEMTNTDRLHASVSLPAANLFNINAQQQTLKASAELTINDLGIIEALAPEVHELKGEATLNLEAGGTLAQPTFNARASFDKGSLRIPRLGLTIDELTLQGQSKASEKFNFKISARSGEGRLAIEGKSILNRAAGWPTEINVKGEQFEVSRIPEAHVLVSPDLQIKLQHNSIDVNGKVHIPYARLQPKDITTAARTTDDAVIIGGEQLIEEKWSVVTSVRLTLGERVNFYGFGFDGRLGGSLLVKDEPGQLTTAIGEINVPEGRYRAYGQRLDVEHGRLLYTGGPVTNPGLDLRAVRKVNNVTAGLKVKGSLRQPQLELFSIPAMGQTDALSYLILGRPMESSSGEDGAIMAKAALAIGLSGGDQLARLLGEQFGLDEMRVESSEKGDQASLVMGRYLSPKLYVSYGVGLIESFNTFTVRYQISDKWQLKAESGEFQGADILYTIEH